MYDSRDFLCISVYQYQVELYTGSESKPGTNTDVSLQIFGQRGDTGLRKLMASKTEEHKLEPGKVRINLSLFRKKFFCRSKHRLEVI